MKPSRPTIFDLAKATGFSAGTISRAFNNHGEISAKTRESILRKAEELGYSPHPGARSITIGKTARWGLLVPHLKNPFYAELMEALDQESRSRDTLLLVGMSHYDDNIANKLVHHWAAGEVDGIIIATSPTVIETKILEALKARGFPAVFLYSPPSEDFDYIRQAEGSGFDRAMRCLIDMGHRRIAYLGLKSAYERYAVTYLAYEKIFLRGLAVKDEALATFTTPDIKAVAEAWRAWRQLKEPPTAVVCLNDILACSLMHVVRSDGLDVPRDVSVIGNDDIGEAMRIGLTTVKTAFEDLAREVFYLLETPRQPGEKGRMRVITGEFIMRDSVAPPRAGAARSRN